MRGYLIALPYDKRFEQSHCFVSFNSNSTVFSIQLNLDFLQFLWIILRKNITLEEISIQNGPPKKINKIIVKIIK